MMHIPQGGGRLPSGFREVQYIEGTGTQYCTTGIVPFDTCAEVDFEYGDTSWSTDAVICGKWDASDQRYYAVNKNNSGKITFTTRKNSAKWTINVDKNRHTIVFNNALHQCLFDGEVKATSQDYVCTAGSSEIGLFCRNNASPLAIAKGKIYYAKFSDNSNDTVIGEFIPCVKTAGNVPGFYDLVSNQFFGSITSDSFIAGPSV